jgi:exodeoxyribonuclease VII large subunit
VAAGIRGFNALKPGGPIPRPDVIIVARGGGSIEDLWPFNEEIVVRAAADSAIPLISAVGHETDTTLIDHASDRRAPTPTGAAEMALPVRAELISTVSTLGARMSRCLTRTVDKRRLELKSTTGRFPKLDRLLQGPRQRLDMASQKFGGSLSRMIARKRARFDQASGGLRPAALRRELSAKRGELQRQAARLAPAIGRRMKAAREGLLAQGRVLETLSYQGVLSRGFALVTKPDGTLLRSAKAISEGDTLNLRFGDGDVAATAGKGTPKPSSPPAAPDQHRPRIRRARRESDQGDLF